MEGFIAWKRSMDEITLRINESLPTLRDMAANGDTYGTPKFYHLHSCQHFLEKWMQTSGLIRQERHEKALITRLRRIEKNAQKHYTDIEVQIDGLLRLMRNSQQTGLKMEAIEDTVFKLWEKEVQIKAILAAQDSRATAISNVQNYHGSETIRGKQNALMNLSQIIERNGIIQNLSNDIRTAFSPVLQALPDTESIRTDAHLEQGYPPEAALTLAKIEGRDIFEEAIKLLAKSEEDFALLLSTHNIEQYSDDLPVAHSLKGRPERQISVVEMLEGISNLLKLCKGLTNHQQPIARPRGLMAYAYAEQINDDITSLRRDFDKWAEEETSEPPTDQT